MEHLKEKVAYLKGLSDGLGINHDSNEGKLLIAIIDVLDDMSREISAIGKVQEELDEYIDAIDQDLEQLEDEVYEDGDDEDDEDDEYFDDEDGYIEVDCPNCHETILLDEEMFEDDEEILCPNCNEPLDIEFECDCGCDHDEDHN